MASFQSLHLDTLAGLHFSFIFSQSFIKHHWTSYVLGLISTNLHFNLKTHIFKDFLVPSQPSISLLSCLDIEQILTIVEFAHRQCYGSHVRRIQFNWNLFNLQCILRNHISDQMVLNLNMFWPFTKNWIFTEVNCTLTIRIYDYFLL